MRLCVHVCDIGGTCYDVCESLQNGCTALILASMRGQLECVRGLLGKGAKVNMQNEECAVSVGLF